MSVGFVMLVHEALDRAAQVARHWSEHGKPVVIHVDKRVDGPNYEYFQQKLADLGNVRFSERHACEWGNWSIVGATQSACELMLEAFPDVRHVYLSSGSCMPLRPVEEIQSYLDDRPRTDFIESVTTDEVDWTVGGLDQERFTLRFPFSWKRQRRLFDGYVDLQRKLKLSRHIPEGLTPHLGSQWWCLTRQTLSAILQDPRRAEFDRYFKRVWIPDESYFQSLARLYSTQIESRSLTLSKFDFQGKPHVFYDDHLQLLRRSDCFVARKIWPRAERLYREFLVPKSRAQVMAEPNPLKIDRLFSRATERRTRGRAGLYMQGRYPNDGWENGKTGGRYSVFEGFTDLFEDFEGWIARRTGNRVHGNLFAADRVQFAGGDAFYNGALSDSAPLREYNPQGFLTNLIWNTRGEHQCFQFGPADDQGISSFLASDRNAQISIISGAWAIPLFHSNRNFAELRKEAANLQRIEAAHLDLLRLGITKARVRIWSLAEFIENPMENLQLILDEIGGIGQRRLSEVPVMADLTGFGQFLQNLKNQGMSPHLMGDFPVIQDSTDKPQGRRPYLVK
ncbi:beta-1,6-N-acetylglucosaminyltransferase [Litoreibacter albidus]|uniref:Peptide O-xylosyltransferase n=1 Tax=Litoreibacter albidus TaxID=670155 RepID=A0A1H2WA08_9RHOB|nr:beta-1,6-N-acetylglucosaminyltransferase [Litoreibacter albidus]SDW77533.1 Core-2/I-Branching enzyme [Litoreibacter albidus]